MKDYFWIFSLLIIFSLSSCNSDEGEATAPTTENKDYPTGTASYFTNSVLATANTARARFNGNDQLSVVFEDDQGKYLILLINDFIGEGVYVNTFPEPENSFDVYYKFVEDDFPIRFMGDPYFVDSLVIDSYNSENGLISGNFNLRLKSGFTYLNISDGIFNDVPIIQLNDPLPGKSNFFYGHLCYSTDSAWAELTNNFQLIMHFPTPGSSPALGARPSLKTYVGLSGTESNHLDYRTGAGTVPSQTYIDRAMNPQFEVHNDFTSVSGRAMFGQGRYFDVSFNQIPILEHPIEISDGVIDLHVGGEMITFTEIYYNAQTISPDFELEAVNDDGQKIVVGSNMFQPNFDINLELNNPGWLTELRFFENENDLEHTWSVDGLFGDAGDRESGVVAVGFHSDTVNFRAENITVQL
ncbi:MAG: hypothetical protein LC664_14820 [Flavobacteriales bacterium]|nr:hypothetical protein [Flavobacteriales bacterium]